MHALVIAAAGLRCPYLLRLVSRRPASPRVVSVPRSTLDWPRVRTRYRTNELWSLFVDLHTDSLCAGGTENWNATWRNRIARCMWNVEGGRQQRNDKSKTSCLACPSLPSSASPLPFREPYANRAHLNGERCSGPGKERMHHASEKLSAHGFSRMRLSLRMCEFSVRRRPYAQMY